MTANSSPEPARTLARTGPLARSPRVLTALAVALLLVLGFVVDVTTPAAGPWQLRAVVYAWIGLGWLLELSARRLPSVLLALATAVPAAAVNVNVAGSVAMLVLIPLVAWTAYTRSGREPGIVLAIALASVASYLPDRDVTAILGVTGVLVSTYVVVRMVLRQQALMTELRAAQSDLLAKAAADERRRIAADIHDVVAHSFAVTLLHLTGARLLALRRGDAVLASALADAEEAGREGMRDLRGVVGLLSEQERPAFEPSIGAAGIVGLTDKYRHAGVDVRLSVDGQLADVETMAGVALFRITQEALANVARHAPSRTVSVEIHVDGNVELVIRNPLGASNTDDGAQGSRGGMGIASMRERARQAGGTLDIDRSNGWWTVTCSVPNGARPETVGHVA